VAHDEPWESNHDRLSRVRDRVLLRDALPMHRSSDNVRELINNPLSNLIGIWRMF
jgi:hypothetical protein